MRNSCGDRGPDRVDAQGTCGGSFEDQTAPGSLRTRRFDGSVGTSGVVATAIFLGLGVLRAPNRAPTRAQCNGARARALKEFSSLVSSGISIAIAAAMPPNLLTSNSSAREPPCENG